jgi:hypothetical protein
LERIHKARVIEQECSGKAALAHATPAVGRTQLQPDTTREKAANAIPEANGSPSAGLCAVCGLDVLLADPPRTPDGRPVHVGCDGAAQSPEQEAK